MATCAGTWADWTRLPDTPEESRAAKWGTVKATFYKRSRGGAKKTVRKRRPGRLAAGAKDDADAVLRAGLNCIRLAGGVDNAKKRLLGLQELIETAKAVQ
jgi:hypothetical protein